MSNELEQAGGGGLGLAFILSEMRDLRKGMETRDENLRGSIDSVRDSVNLLSSKVDRSQGDLDKVQGEVSNMREHIESVRLDVDTIMDERKIDKIAESTAWAGPVRVLRNIAMVGAAVAGLIAILNFWPAIAPFLIALTAP